MKVAIITGSARGTASHHLPVLAESGCCEIAVVILSQGGRTGRWKHLRRKLAKVRRIGLAGALNGIRMRNWFSADVHARLGVEDLEAVCRRYGIPFRTTPALNAAETVNLLRGSGAELGISLGNGYIAERVFSALPLGMVNIHHEMLPAYQNAQSVIWQIHDGSPMTGYTIHRIDKRIDTGAILYQEAVPILFRGSLRRTVTETVAALYERSAQGLVRVLSDPERMIRDARPQGPGRARTTPTLRQYLRMVRNHRRLAAEARAAAGRGA